MDSRTRIRNKISWIRNTGRYRDSLNTVLCSVNRCRRITETISIWFHKISILCSCVYYSFLAFLTNFNLRLPFSIALVERYCITVYITWCILITLLEMLELVAFLLLGVYLETPRNVKTSTLAFLLLYVSIFLETPRNFRTSSFSFTWCWYI
jgi:hypothetical protein